MGKRTRIGIWLLASFMGIGSCGPKHLASPADPIVFPPPPDTARIQFLTRISHSQDVEGAGSSFWRSLIGEAGREAVKPIVKPYGIAIHAGKIYVCDTGLRLIEIIDLGKRSFDYFQPRGLGKLTMPINCSVDPSNGWLYVADADRGQIVVFDAAGRYASSFGDAEQARPTDVFVDDARIWVSDLGQRRVRVFDKASLSELEGIPRTREDGPGRLYSPTNVYVRDDRVYVSDFGDFKVKVYSHNGDYLTSVGSYGRGLGQFARPKGIAVDRDLNLYVVDASFENVQVFDRDGRLLMFFGGPYEGPGNMWLPAKVVLDYDNLEYFRQYVHEGFELKYLILVTNQYGPDRVSVYGFVEPRKGFASGDSADR